MTSQYIIPKRINTIVITYLPGDDLTWAYTLKDKHPSINFLFFEINAKTTPILASRGFNTVPAIQYWPRGRQSFSVQGNFDIETIETDIKHLLMF